MPISPVGFIRISLFAIVILLSPTLLCGQDKGSRPASKAAAPSPPPSPKPDQSRPKDIVNLIRNAHSAAPALAADTLIRLLEAKKVSEKEWRKELIDEIFRLIDEVPARVSLRPVSIRGINLSNTNIYLIAAASSLKLDQLSLKSRVIKILAESEPERARQIVFDLGGQLKLRSRSCEDALIYDVNSIYTAAAQVAKMAFPESQIVDGRRALFLLPWVETIESPTQLVPAMALIEQVQGPLIERRMLFNALSKSMDRSFNDDRSFSATANSVGMKIASSAVNDETLKRQLLDAYRGFLAKNIQSTRCRDNVITRNDLVPDYIETANKLLPEKPLALDDIVTRSSEGAVKTTDLAAKSASIRMIIEELRKLQSQVGDNKSASPITSDLEWQQSVRMLVEKVISFDGKDGETDEEVIFVKCSTFGAILQIVKTPELRKLVFRSSILTLSRSPIQKTNFPTWFYLAKGLQQADRQLFSDLALETPNSNLNMMIEAARGISN